MRRLTACAAIGLLVSLPACSGGTRVNAVATPATNAAPTTLLTIGGSATEGDGLADRYREAWPYLLFHEAFPLSTSLVNAAVDGATVANVPSEQLSLAGEVKPDVVAIWLGIDDLSQRTPIDVFTAELTTAIQDLRASGSRRILVADLPKAYGNVAPYNTAIRAVVRSTKSTLVELDEAAVVLASDGRFPAQPDTTSQRVIATAFEQAFKSAS